MRCSRTARRPRDPVAVHVKLLRVGKALHVGREASAKKKGKQVLSARARGRVGVVWAHLYHFRGLELVVLQVKVGKRLRGARDPKYEILLSYK